MLPIENTEEELERKKSVSKGGISDCGLVCMPGHSFYYLLTSF